MIVKYSRLNSSFQFYHVRRIQFRSELDSYTSGYLYIQRSKTYERLITQDTISKKVVYLSVGEQP